MGFNSIPKRATKGLFINTICALYAKNVTKSPVQLITTRTKKYSTERFVTVVLEVALPANLSGTS